MNAPPSSNAMKTLARPNSAPLMRKRRLRVALFASLVVVVIAGSSCGVGEKRESIPAGAQETVDRLTEDVAEGRSEKIYDEAADEWRQAATAEQNAAAIERLRVRLGKVESRTPIKRTQQPNAGGPLSGHTLELIYQTSFEHGTGTENITLVERDGRWLLARYAVSSDALKP